MFNQFNSTVKNPLLKAMLNNNITEVLSLSKDDSLRNTKDYLGFTPLEIGKLLDMKESVKILDNSPQKSFKVMHEGYTKPEECSIEMLQKVFGIRYLPYLRITNYGALQEVVRQCPWILRTCIGKDNRVLAEKYKTELNNGYVANTIIKWIDEKIGYGLFLNQDLPAGAYVGEYTGLVRQLYRSSPDHNPYCFKYPTKMWCKDYYVVDAMWQGNETRFVNHSAQPNLEPVCLMDRNLLHTAFLTNKAISAGTELTFDYGPDFWKKS